MDLSKANRKLSMDECSIKEYALFLESFVGKTITIFTVDNEIPPLKINITKENLVHLIGLHYCYDKKSNKSNYIGSKGLELLKSGALTIQELRRNFRKILKRKISVFRGQMIFCQDGSGFLFF